MARSSWTPGLLVEVRISVYLMSTTIFEYLPHHSILEIIMLHHLLFCAAALLYIRPASVPKLKNRIPRPFSLSSSATRRYSGCNPSRTRSCSSAMVIMDMHFNLQVTNCLEDTLASGIYSLSTTTVTRVQLRSRCPSLRWGDVVQLAKPKYFRCTYIPFPDLPTT